MLQTLLPHIVNSFPKTYIRFFVVVDGHIESEYYFHPLESSVTTIAKAIHDLLIPSFRTYHSREALVSDINRGIAEGSDLTLTSPGYSTIHYQISLPTEKQLAGLSRFSPHSG